MFAHHWLCNYLYTSKYIYNPRDIHTPFSLPTRLQYSHLQIHCFSSWKLAMLCWHVECKLQLLFGPLNGLTISRYLIIFSTILWYLWPNIDHIRISTSWFVFLMQIQWQIRANDITIMPFKIMRYYDITMPSSGPFSTNDCKLDVFLWIYIEAVTSVKSQCTIARNDEESSLYRNGNLISFTEQSWLVRCFQSGISFAHFGINFAVLNT